MFSLVICDILERFTEADTVIMGDVSIAAIRLNAITVTRSHISYR